MRVISFAVVLSSLVVLTTNHADAQGRDRCNGNAMIAIAPMLPIGTLFALWPSDGGYRGAAGKFVASAMTVIAAAPALALLTGGVLLRVDTTVDDPEERWLRRRCRARWALGTGSASVLSALTAITIELLRRRPNEDRMIKSALVGAAGLVVLVAGVIARARLGDAPSEMRLEMAMPLVAF